MYVESVEISGFRQSSDESELTGVVALVAKTVRIAVSVSLERTKDDCALSIRLRAIEAALRTARRMPELRGGTGLGLSPETLVHGPVLTKAA